MTSLVEYIPHSQDEEPFAKGGIYLPPKKKKDRG